MEPLSKATWSPTLCPQLIEALYFKKGSALVNDILNILALFYFVLQRSEMVEITSMPQWKAVKKWTALTK